ncbi:hypothetical protein TNIN_33531 [Trichonephila inaurata madagascariensis]|uniref:Uncharacterized protein n=1 Tax=Trichonephila inaurata madagascariensis TaxID=2747483 RepID=A0A8X6WSX6_9ARAC|nr:hypothetical protein TNIN_33531 [Trichonephila inaurata madagascariensis]
MGLYWKKNLLQTYHTFTLLLLTYYCEPFFWDRETCTRYSGQIQSLRIVAGSVKTTPINPLLTLTVDKPLKTLIQEKAEIFFEKIIKIPRYFSLWNEINQDLSRNLRIQKGFLQGVPQLKNLLGLSHEPELRVPPQNSIKFETF